MTRKIFALELTLWEIDLEPNGSCEGERIVKKSAALAHYDGSRSEAEARVAYAKADSLLQAMGR